jgi:catechol 2,3-dioxygenase-like lactoylglutathione lyase family enzyme
MSSVQMHDSDATTSVGRLDMKLEVIIIPVSDVDRAKQFYESLGWRIDTDIARGDSFRIVQVTPPGSGCSVAFGNGLTTAAPGTAQTLELIVSDIDAVRDDLLARGVEAVEVFHAASAASHRLEQPLERRELVLPPQELTRPQARQVRGRIVVAARSGRWGARPLLLRGSFP